MGTYTTLYLNDYDLVSSKSRVVPEVMTVFVEKDLRTQWRRPDDGSLADGPGREDEDITQEADYVVSVRHACRRLDVMGFTLARCRREYEQIRADELKGAQDARAEEIRSGAQYETDWLDEEIRNLEALPFDEYAKAFKSVFGNRLRSYDVGKKVQGSELSRAEGYILVGDHEDWPHFGFLCNDVRSFIRLALTVAADDDELRQDISDLLHSGWVDEGDRVRDEATRELLERYPENAPRIILTEGSSDAIVLEKALRVLYPELQEYYTFFDFHGTRAAGGAGQLVSVVKAFAAAGVANRTIAIFDNDTAAHEARRALNGVGLPPHIAVLNYPERELLRAYPTVGPSGEIDLDVNGSAGNLELYLGRDVLTVDAQLERVQWAGYSKAVGAYQGELINKSEVAERWHAKADRCLRDRARVVQADWEDLRGVWEHIFRAFDDA